MLDGSAPGTPPSAGPPAVAVDLVTARESPAPNPLSSIPVSELAAAIHASLDELPGVERVVVSEGAQNVLLLCDPHEAHDSVLRTARERLAASGLDPDAVTLEVVIPANRRERRVKFESIRRAENPDRSISMHTRLSWGGEVFEAEATGEKGDTIELRTAANSTLRAVEMVTGEPLNLRLVGVKHLRAFDGDVVVVSIYGGPGRKTLLGVVLAGQDPYRATAVAVLMALNRLLGNYLATR